MTDASEGRAQVPRIIRYGVIAFAVVGLSGLLLALMIGFEEPNSVLLWPCSVMTLAGPVAVVTHLTWTHTLTADRKRVWWTAFAGPDVFSALSEYLSSTDLSASADWRATAAEGRSRRRDT